jgi:hypothetical protein
LKKKIPQAILLVYSNHINSIKEDGGMRKLLAALIVVVFVFAAVPAMATTAKVPKTLCLDFASFLSELQLTFKALGTIYDAGTGSSVKTYAITGYLNDAGPAGPVTGTAYITPGTTILHANFNGMIGGPSQTVFFFELFYDLGSGSGTLQYNVIGLVSGSTTVNGVDCDMLSYNVQDGTASGSGMAANIAK